MEIDQTPPSETVYSDHAVTIHSIHLIAETSGDEISETCSRKRRRSASPNPKSFTDMAVAYVGRIADKPGALVMAKCIAHGVPPGPLLAQLKDGQDVLLKDGRTVKANDVRMPNSPGPVFMIVECPTDRHIESLLTDPLIKSHQQSAEKLEDAMEVVIHLTPSHVLRSEKYVRIC
jgi:ribonuclease Z